MRALGELLRRLRRPEALDPAGDAQVAAELPLAASLAKSQCSQAYFHCAAESIQLHGGVGFTWEYDPHLYFKRARPARATSAHRPGICNKSPA